MTSNKKTSFPSAWLVFILSFFLFYFGAQNRPFSAPDEGRYVEIPLEMAQSNDFITPRLNGVKYFEKPPLFYWAQAGFIKAFGPDEWAMRLLPALSGSLTVLVVFLLGAHLFSHTTGLFAATTLSTSFLFFALNHIIVIDTLFSALVTLSLGCFLWGLNAPPGKTRLRYALLTSVFLALAVLTKGLVALIFFGGIALPWAFLNRNALTLWPLYILPSLALFCAIVLPWHILAQLKNPEFFDFYIIHEHFARFLEKGHNREQPFYFFIPVILFGFLPWSPFFIWGLLKSIFKPFPQKSNIKNLSFFGIWAGFIFMFFSLSSSKLITYMLPVFPALSILTGHFLAQAIKNNTHLTKAMLTYSLICAAAVVFYLLNKDRIPEADVKTYSPYIQLMVIALGAGAVFPTLITRFVGNKAGLFSLLTIGLLQLALLVLATQNGTSAEVKSSYLYIKNNMPKETKILSYHHLHHDLPAYAQKPIQIVDYEGELLFGKTQEPHHPVFVSESAFWTRWFSPEKLCVLAYKDYGRSVFFKNLQQRAARHPTATPTQKHPFEKRLARNIPMVCNIAPYDKE